MNNRLAALKNLRRVERRVKQGLDNPVEILRAAKVLDRASRAHEATVI